MRDDAESKLSGKFNSGKDIGLVSGPDQRRQFRLKEMLCFVRSDRIIAVYDLPIIENEVASDIP